ncbi:MAG: T9SS type A sorting domain-containing protein [Bacteroidota bacterium]
MIRSIISVLIITIIAVSQTTATEYYCDPVNGNISNNGSHTNPWSSFADVVQANKTLIDGDVIYLLDGNHGRAYISNYLFGGAGVIVKALNGHDPVITTIQFSNSSNWTFQDIKIEGIGSGLPKDGFMVTSDLSSNYLTFDNCIIQSAESSSSWTKDDWYSNSMGGIDIRGHHIVVENCTIKNTYHALFLRGNNSRASNNLIDNFAGDAIRGLGDFSVFEFNTVRDCYIDDYALNHDDAFQAYRVNGQELKMEGIIIRNNKFLLFEDEITQFVIDNDLIGNLMQGIIITDGYADGWIVENNLVVNDHSHGISLYGARNCRVQNNTVVQHPYYTDIDVPWVLIADNSKTGQANFDNIIRNNIATKFTTWTYAISNIFENNIDINENNPVEYTDLFADYANLDFHLKQSSAAVDYGNNADLPATDLDGNPRVFNSVVDAGAYEFSENTPPIYMTPIPDQVVEEGQELTLYILVTDVDGNALSFSCSGLPPFGFLTDNGDGTGTITFLPGEGDAGIYSNISLSVTDGYTTVTDQFSLTVNAAQGTLTITPLSNQTIQELEVLNLSLSSIYSGSGTLVFTGNNMPSFGTLTDKGNGTATIRLAPQKGDWGAYSEINIKLTDGILSDSIVFDLLVEELVLGIGDVMGSKLLVYPNPSNTGNISILVPEDIKGTEYILEVLNSTGQPIYSNKLGSSSEIIKLNNLISGIYILQITNKNRIYHSRFIID